MPKILVIGTGSIGRCHAYNASRLGAEVWAYSYRQHEAPHAAPFLSEGVRLWEGDLDEALHFPFDGVVIANRTHQHMPLALKAAEAGRNLFIEKPLSNAMEGVAELQTVVAEHDLIVETGFMLRFHPNLLFMKFLLEEGRLGVIHYARTLVGQYLGDWRPGTDYHESYSAKRALGGGAIFDLVHEIDVVRWMLGEVAEVVAMTRYEPSLEIETEAVAQIGARMESGVLVQIHLDYVHPSYARKMEIVGSKNVLYWDYPSGRVTLTTPEGERTIVHQVPNGFERNYLFLSHMDAFIQRIAGNQKEAVSSLQDGVGALRVALASHRAAREGRVVRPNDIK